jgi:hypothetical protein
MQPFVILRLMVLLMLANGTPVLAKKLFGNRFSRPLDGGIRFIDGRPLLGASKTIRGVLLAILVTSAGALLIGVGLKIGTLVGGIAMAGDLFSSFLKRRIDLPPSSRAIGLDQVPESLFPLLACREALSLTALDIASTVAVFFVGELLLSRLLYRVHLRDQPY